MRHKSLKKSVRAAKAADGTQKQKVLITASVASMISQFNMPNICLLQSMGYEVHVACNFKDGNTCDEKSIIRLQQRLRAMRVRFYQWDCPRSIHAFQKCFQAYFQMWRLTKRHSYDMIHCHSPVGGVLARIVAHSRKIPVVYTAHGFHFYRGAPAINWFLYYPVEKLLSCWTDVLVTVNREDYIFAERNLHAKAVCRINGIGIDTAELAEGSLGQHKKIRGEYCIPENAVLLLSVGELNENKNHRIVIDAVAQLYSHNVYYLICGQGRLKDWLVRYAESLHISDRVRIPGYVEDLSEIYHAADLFILPSRREGMPVSLMEAMAAGLPCAASDIRGCRELIDCGGGIRFDPEDSSGQACAEAVRRMLAWREKDAGKVQEMGIYNQKKIQKYDRKSVLRKMKYIYQNTAAGEWKR